MWCLLEQTTDEARWLMVPLPTGDDVRAAAPSDPGARPPAAS
jgi:hypothetical protein